MAGVGEEQPRVPVPLLALHKHPGKIPVGLLGKRLYLVDIARTRICTLLYVAVAGFGTGRTDAHREECVIGLDELQSFCDIPLKVLLIDNVLVGG